MINNWLTIIQNYLLPPTCILCDSPGFEGKDICRECFAQIVPNINGCYQCCGNLWHNNSGLICQQCLKNPPHFDKTFAPFVYTGIMRYLILHLKATTDYSQKKSNDAKTAAVFDARMSIENDFNIPENIKSYFENDLSMPENIEAYFASAFNTEKDIVAYFENAWIMEADIENETSDSPQKERETQKTPQYANARLLGILFAEQRKKNGDLPECIIPVPLHKNRYQKRGFNQSLEIARVIAKQLNIPLNYSACIRHKDTKHQVGLSGIERQLNLEDAFSMQCALPFKHVAILDDVMTTGNTLSGIAEVLKQSGAEKVEVWACARARHLYRY